MWYPSIPSSKIWHFMQIIHQFQKNIDKIRRWLEYKHPGRRWSNAELKNVNKNDHFRNYLKKRNTRMDFLVLKTRIICRTTLITTILASSSSPPASKPEEAPDTSEMCQAFVPGKYDAVGPIHPVSNLRPWKVARKFNETSLAVRLRHLKKHAEIQTNHLDKKTTQTFLRGGWNVLRICLKLSIKKVQIRKRCLLKKIHVNYNLW